MSRQHSDGVLGETLAVARYEMPAEGGMGVSTRTTRGERGERFICSICHGLVEETDRVQVSRSSDVHRRCALGFCEDAIPRARFVGGPNPALREVQEVDFQPLLQQVLILGRSADTPDERAIRSSVTAAELRLWSKTHLAPERMTCLLYTSPSPRD